MPTIHEMLDQVVAYSRQTIALALALKGEAQTDESLPGPQPPAASRFTSGKSSPDSLGRVELELVERLVKEFGEAPNGYRLPRLWYVPEVVVSHLPDAVRGDYQQNVGSAGFNKNLAYSYNDGWIWGGRKSRVKDAVLPDCLAWNDTLANLENALRYRIRVHASGPAYVANPELPAALRSVAGFVDLVIEP